MLVKIFEWAKSVILVISIILFIQFVFEPSLLLSSIELDIEIIIALSFLNILVSFVSSAKNREGRFASSPVIVFVWFLFLRIVGVFPIFISHMGEKGKGFSIVLTVVTMLILFFYLYATLRKVVKTFREVKIKPYAMIALSFAGLIFIGGIILFLPISLASNQKVISLLDAFFTSTSAVCVTGLTVVDTGSFFSRFGQTVILVLIQLGGLGLMTFAAFFSVVTGEKMSIYGRVTLQTALSGGNLSTIGRFVKAIIFTTFFVEFIGAAFLFIRFSETKPLLEAIYFSIFHSVSAFCNAGFSLFSDNLCRFRGDILINVVVMLLIIVGGIGFPVIVNILERLRKKEKRLSLNTRLVLITTLCLIFFGAIIFYLMEQDNLLKGIPTKEKILASLFSSVTPRTAGFNTVDFGIAKEATLLFICILMFIGASPGGTGGGIKTTTFAVIVLNTINTMRDKLSVEIFNREIPFDVIRKSIIVFFLSILWLAAGTILIALTEKILLSKVLFEEFSAFGTVGLSTGITATLKPFSKIVLMMTMFIGRIGPMTLVFSLGMETSRMIVRRPEEKVLTG